jgi:3-hydroxyisobutyrate dehydrogenase
MAHITVLGTGAMGARMAVALLRAGYAVTIWNRGADKTRPLVAAGARTADTPHAAVRNADCVISMLRDDDAASDVWMDPRTGALAGMTPAAVAIESSTVTVAWAQALHAACAARDVACIDAPVVGSRPQADAAQLIYFAGGDTETVMRAEPILMAMGSVVHHAGPAGSGAALKLAINTLFGVQVAVLAELMGLLQHSGIDTAKAIDIITSTPVCSPAARAAAGGMLSRQFTPLFPIELVAKDFRYALAWAASFGAQLPIAQATAGIFNDAVQRGHGGDNITGVIQAYLEG